MEVLNLIRLFWGWGFPYISLTYSLYMWGFLHFRYLKCLVMVVDNSLRPGLVTKKIKSWPLWGSSPGPRGWYHCHRRADLRWFSCGGWKSSKERRPLLDMGFLTAVYPPENWHGTQNSPPLLASMILDMGCPTVPWTSKHLLRRYLDLKIFPLTPSQEVFGFLGVVYVNYFPMVIYTLV